MHSDIYKKFIGAGAALLVILVAGTVGYRFIGGAEYSFLDALYMTVITISTIGFGEIIDMSASPAGRVFTIFIALSGVGVLFYIITNFTAYVVEGELKESFRRKKMEKMAKKYKGHYIVCGIGRVGFHIANELSTTGRPFVVVDTDINNIDKFSEVFPDRVFIEGDATDNETLLTAGIERASGVFAVTGDDNQNLVVSLTAKDLNPSVKVIARCSDTRHSGKMKKAGADAVVSPNLIGGLRMASEMIRPSVVSFLDTMLRDTGKNLRVEEVRIPDTFTGRTISALDLKAHPDVLLLAVRAGAEWVYNPSGDYTLKAADILVFMTTPEDRGRLDKVINPA